MVWVNFFLFIFQHFNRIARSNHSFIFGNQVLPEKHATALISTKL
ncbi:Uncharacterised protein [Vibrio cholerae]|nr:Uncharacterised protein [Vibrio cholerae]